jgi:hypothetical protein
MLTEIVSHSLAGHVDVQLVIAEAPSSGLVAAVRDTGADVVVGAESQLACPEVSALLDDLPRSRVFTLTPDARMAWLYELRPERVALGEVSPERLAQAIRVARHRTVCEAVGNG